MKKMMVAVLVLLVVPVAAQVQVTPFQETWLIPSDGLWQYGAEYPMTILTPSVTCPSPSTYSFAVELRRMIEAREQKLKVLRELLAELEKDWVGDNSTLTILTPMEKGCDNCITFDGADLVIDRTIEYDPKQ